jgi:hypothetical protein
MSSQNPQGRQQELYNPNPIMSRLTRASEEVKDVANSLLDPNNLYAAVNGGLAGDGDAAIEAKFSDLLRGNPFNVNSEAIISGVRDRLIEAAGEIPVSETVNIVRGIAEQVGMDQPKFFELLSALANEQGIAAPRIEMLKQAFNLIDRNSDSKVSREEVMQALGNEAILESLDGINSTIGRLIRDPNFRIRIIDRPAYQSIYGPRSSDNQETMVQVGEADYLANANSFNVSF